MKNSSIEWCHHTFNGWIGCTKVSPACKFCYAEEQQVVEKLGIKWGAGKPRHRTSVQYWKQPLAWNKEAQAKGIRYRVFTNSLADVFDEEVNDDWRFDLFDLIAATPSLDWLLLTKRPEYAVQFGEAIQLLPNIWLGTSVENQKYADLRIPILKTIPARIRFLSCEPLLEETSLADHLSDDALHWIIVGGESSTDGVSARPMKAEWARKLRDECTARKVPFFFKQWGGRHKWEKIANGRELDGVLWDEFPVP